MNRYFYYLDSQDNEEGKLNRTKAWLKYTLHIPKGIQSHFSGKEVMLKYCSEQIFVIFSFMSLLQSKVYSSNSK